MMMARIKNKNKIIFGRMHYLVSHWRHEWPEYTICKRHLDFQACISTVPYLEMHQLHHQLSLFEAHKAVIPGLTVLAISCLSHLQYFCGGSLACDAICSTTKVPKLLSFRNSEELACPSCFEHG